MRFRLAEIGPVEDCVAYVGDDGSCDALKGIIVWGVYGFVDDATESAATCFCPHTLVFDNAGWI